MNYTRSELRTAVGEILRDSNGGLYSNARKNRALNRIHRDLIERSECNRNVLVFSLASGSANGAIEYDKNGNAPTITRIDVEGRNYYLIDNCVLIDKVNLWDDTALRYKELPPLSQFEIDQLGLLKTSARYPLGYQQLDAPDTIQLLPALQTASYPYKFEARYREGFRDLVTYDGSPTDSTVVQTTGNGVSDLSATVTAVKIPVKFRITALTKAAPDTVKTEKNIYDGNGWTVLSATTNLTGSDQTLAHGATFKATTFTNSHTVGDVFEFAVDDYLTPSCRPEFRHVLINGACGELLRIERDPEYKTYMAQYERDVERVKAKARRLNSDQASRIRNDYSGAGG